MHHLGLTRSANRRDHLLLTPDTFIRTPLPGLIDGFAIVHVSPQVGAGFTMMTVELEKDGRLSEGPTQRFLYVLEGTVALEQTAADEVKQIEPGGYAYLPAGEKHSVRALENSRVVVIDKPLESSTSQTSAAISTIPEATQPWFFAGHEPDLASTALNGDNALQVKALMPSSMAFDFACNTMSYEPGASLSQVEVHYMEHGLLMLEGGGIYRLGDDWYPVQAGDFIWMAPYCPQWFCAVGKQPAKYLIYKNFNRHPLG